MIAPIASRNASTDCSMWRGALLARGGVLRDLRGEVAVAPHRVLEDLDRARQCADLVGAVRVGHHDVLGAVSDLLDGRGDGGERACDRAGDDDDADHDEGERHAGEAGQDEGQDAIGLGLVRDLPRALGIDFGQRLEILVQRRAHGAVGVVVAPFAARGRIDLDAAAHQLLAKLDELLDALLEGGELFGIVSLDDGLPALHDVEDLGVELEQALAVFLHHGRFGRHVDAA
ncbi:hypothetical protein ACVWXL_001780 [Bradyrhizobium sp. GM22.5]